MVWYDDLRGQNPRGYHFEPVSHAEILAYRTLHHLEESMTSFDVDMLVKVDGIWRSVQPDPESGKAPTPPPPGQ